MNAETVGEALRRVARALAEAGIEESRKEARRLVEFAAGLDRAAQIARAEEPLPAGARASLAQAVAHRRMRRPLQHLEGWVEFFGLALACDARALVPRPDSECVVDAALARLPADFSGCVADLGAGSGCLLAAILMNRRKARGVGVEADGGAADLAEANLRRLGLDARAELVRARWADWTGWGEADLIVSNPPYVRAGDIDGLAPEVRDHDPRAALDGGADGLDCYREIAALGAAQMRDGSWLVLEIGWDQAADVRAILEGAGFGGAQVRRDLGGRDRVVLAAR